MGSTVRGLSDVRGSAEIAQKLYAETEESIVKRQQEADQKKFFKEPGMTHQGPAYQARSAPAG